MGRMKDFVIGDMDAAEMTPRQIRTQKAVDHILGVARAAQARVRLDLYWDELGESPEPIFDVTEMADWFTERGLPITC